MIKLLWLVIRDIEDKRAPTRAAEKGAPPREPQRSRPARRRRHRAELETTLGALSVHFRDRLAPCPARSAELAGDLEEALAQLNQQPPFGSPFSLRTGRSSSSLPMRCCVSTSCRWSGSTSWCTSPTSLAYGRVRAGQPARRIPVEFGPGRRGGGHRTAEHHIQNIYTKIGVSNRAAATRWAVAHGVADGVPGG